MFFLRICDLCSKLSLLQIAHLCITLMYNPQTFILVCKVFFTSYIYLYFFTFQQGMFAPSDFKSTLECDAPTTKIYKFNGCIEKQSGERVPLGKDNLLLRECVLKNTDYIEGLVVYAGKDSKAMLNNGGPK